MPEYSKRVTHQVSPQAQAQNVLRHYGLHASRLDLLGSSHSTVYRVTTTDEEVFALRFHDAARHPKRSLEAELIWLAHLDRLDPGLAPKPIPSESGD